MSTVEQLLADNPFPGLRAFLPREADRFFGRQQQIDELVRRIDQGPFLVVAGASGCGKSSLVLAGLIPALRQRYDQHGGTDWRTVVMRPGNCPIEILAQRLSDVLTGEKAVDEIRASALDGRLRLGGRGLVEVVRLARLEPHVRLLVVVDQFEEIFRFKRMIDPEEAAAFVKLLLHAANDPQSPVTVVLTMRSDALGQCADFNGLPEAVNCGHYLVPRLTRDQRKDAIAEPVKFRGFTIAPRLVQRVLNDVSDDFDDLPVMQHVLTRTWQRWARASAGSRDIDLEDYDEVGGAANALSKHADEAYFALADMQEVVEKVFRALTERVADGSEIRRPLDFEQLCAVIAGSKESTAKVLERFRRPDTAFLLPPLDVPLEENPVIDISHESLIRRWTRLQEWTRVEAEVCITLRRLVRATQRWQHNEGDLWRGRDLERAVEWKKSVQPTHAWVLLNVGTNDVAVWDAAQQFLADSHRAVRREQRRWWLTWGLGGLATITVVVSLAAANWAMTSRHQSASRELANRALLHGGQDPARSARLALAALDFDSDNSSAEFALRQSLATLEVGYTERILELGEPIVSTGYSRDGSRLLVASEKHVWIIDAKRLDQGPRRLNGSSEVFGHPIRFDTINTLAKLKQAWLIANKSLLGQYDDGHAEVRTPDGRLIRNMNCEGVDNAVLAIAVSQDEHHVAVGCRHGGIDLWQVDGENVRRLAPFQESSERLSSITALAFSNDSGYLASGNHDGVVNIWKIGHKGPWISGDHTDEARAIRHKQTVRDLSFYPTSSELLATASDDNSAAVWQLDLVNRRRAAAKKGEKGYWHLTKHDRPVTIAKFVPRGSEPFLLTISDKRVRHWLNEDQRQMRRHDDWVLDANGSADGELFVSASNDGLAHVWSTRSRTPVAELRGHHNAVTRAFFAPDDQTGGQTRRVITASRDGTVRFWRVRPPRLVDHKERKWVLDAAFDPSGGRIAVCGESTSDRARDKSAKGSHCTVRQLDDSDGQVGNEPIALDAVGADAVTKVSWSHDGKWLLGIHYLYGMYEPWKPILWDVQTQRDITPKWLKDYQTATFSSSTPEILTVDVYGGVSLWSTSALLQEKPIPLIELDPEPGRWLARLSPDGRWIAAIDADSAGNYITLWQRDDPKAAPTRLCSHRGGITDMRFSSDSQWIVTASTDRTAGLCRAERTVDGRNPKPQILGAGHTAALSSASFNQKGTHVVTTSADNTIRIWSAKRGHQVAKLNWHSDAVNHAQFSPNGQWILSVSDDGTVRVDQCEACTLDLKQLRERVEHRALLTATVEQEIEQAKHVRMRWLALPEFLSRKR